MRLITYLFVFLSYGIFAQTSVKSNVTDIDIEIAKPNNKIKVYLLGSFHFAQTDSTYNVLDNDKQESIEEKRNHDKIYQCDHSGQFGHYSSKAYQYAEMNNQLDALQGERVGTTVREDDLVNEDSIMHHSSLLDYLRWINSDKVMSSSHAFYLTNFPQVGSKDYYNYDDDNTLIGAELTSNWYHRNIMIYTKIINQLTYKEDSIFLIMGSDHIPIIKNLFDGNPYFEVIHPKEWLF